MIFQIITSRKVAEQIEMFSKSNVGNKYSFEIKYIIHKNEYSEVTISGIDGEKIKPSDLFFLGYFSASY